MHRRFVTTAAVELMECTADTAADASKRVLAQLVEQSGSDAAFLRQNDHSVGASNLLAEWPERLATSDPDPLAVIHFSDADPVYGLCGHISKPAVIRPAARNVTHSRWTAKSRTEQWVALAPLLSGGLTTGVLGVVRTTGKRWTAHELDTIEVVASLFAQSYARTAAEDRLRHLADHDELTGLLNRRALATYLSERLAPGQPGPVAVLYLDLDRLKAINDYLGHTAGDRFIGLFADRLRACVGNCAEISRVGGDEFVIIPAEAMPTAAANDFADQLRTMLRGKVTLNGIPVTRTVSIGVAVGQPGRDNGPDVMEGADEAVLRAKEAGGDRTVMATDNVHLRKAFRQDIELYAQGQMDTDALVLHYLPEVDLWGGAVIAAEALVRWRHPTQGLLLPGAFINVAESANLASELGQWVMRSACGEFSRWRSGGVGQSATLRVNVSPAQLVTPGFVRSVADVLDEFGLDGNSLCLEITERMVVRDLETTLRTLTALKEVGIQIAIDDFGTGYAVLSHLKSLPIDILKIDKAFIQHLGTDAGDLAIVRAIIALADAFDLQVVAEGVETPAAALTLLQHGCHRAQGFLLSRPVPATAMESLLSERWIPMPFLTDSNALASDMV